MGWRPEKGGWHADAGESERKEEKLETWGGVGDWGSRVQGEECVFCKVGEGYRVRGEQGVMECGGGWAVGGSRERELLLSASHGCFWYRLLLVWPSWYFLL